MSYTSLQVGTEALRMLRVVAEDEAATADQLARTTLHMTDIFAYLSDTEGLAFDWTIETVPEGAFLAFARAVAGSVASTYGKPEPTIQRPDGQVTGAYRMGIEGLRRNVAKDFSEIGGTTHAEYF